MTCRTVDTSALRRKLDSAEPACPAAVRLMRSADKRCTNMSSVQAQRSCDHGAVL
jgi:hypothetical protein